MGAGSRSADAGGGSADGGGAGSGSADAGGGAADVGGTAGASAGWRPELVWPESTTEPAASSNDGVLLRVLAGPLPGLEALIARTWRVALAADRVGIRLDRDGLPAGIGGETTTHGVPWGAIQVPADGHPIILGADHQATGGYRVLGVVISADLPILGQLRPGAPLRLATTDRSTALAALRERRDALLAGAAALREAARWAALIDAAGS